MNWLLRAVIYVPVLFLICVVYAGQRHDTAADTLKTSARLCGKGLLYTAVLVLVMQALEFVFID